MTVPTQRCSSYIGHLNHCLHLLTYTSTEWLRNTNLRGSSVVRDELKIPKFNIFIETARHYTSLPAQATARLQRDVYLTMTCLHKALIPADKPYTIKIIPVYYHDSNANFLTTLVTQNTSFGNVWYNRV